MMIYTTKLKDRYVPCNTTGEVVSIADIINEMQNSQNLKSLPKENKPVLQNQISGKRLQKNDPDYFKFWTGLIFVDIDNKYNWSPEYNDYYIKMFHQKLSQYPWYICTTISASETGIHIIGYIPARFHTQVEYYISSAVIYSRVSNTLSSLTNKSVEQLYKDKVIDTHNFKSYSQTLCYTYGKTLVNKSFNPDSYRQLEIHTDKDYYSYILKQNALNASIKKLMQTCLFKDNRVNDTLQVSSSLSLPDIITFTGGDFFDFKYDDRLQLVYTLLNYYSKEDTFYLIDKIYLATYGNDCKYRQRMKEIKSLINSTNDRKTPNLRVLRILKCSYNIKLEADDNMITTSTEDEEITIDLKSGYLSDRMPQIMSNLGDLTVLESPAASGKTTAIANLNENIILTEPYTAIIKNKIENNKKLDAFGCLYGSRRITDEEFVEKTKFCCTPNNLLTLTPEILLSKDIKYVFVDESHTIIADAEFRLQIMSHFCDKLKEFIQAGIKVILMTATPLNEFFLMFNSDIKIMFIKVKKEHTYRKELHIKHYATADDRYTDLVNDIANSIKAGYKCIAPTNYGDNYVTRITNSLKNRIPKIANANITYYTKEHSNEKLNEDITYSACIDNADIIFAGTSLSVGVDINNTDKCRIFFIDRIQDYNIEQFSARLRNTDKECYMYVVDSDNTYQMRDYSYPYANEKFNSATQLVTTYNQNKLFKETEPLDQRTLDYYPYIELDNNTLDYHINHTTWNLMLMQYKTQNYNSQLSVIINNCSIRYGFSVNDNRNVITVDNSSKIIDNNISKMTHKEIKMKEYDIINRICEMKNLSEESARNQSINELDRTRRQAFKTITQFLDKRIKIDIVQMMLQEALDHDKRQLKKNKLSNFIQFAEIYWNFRFKLKDTSTLERYVNSIISFTKEKETVRRETRDKFIERLQKMIADDRKTTDINTAKILFESVVECTEIKKNKFQMKVRKFIHRMFNDEEAADNTSVNISSVECVDLLNI